MRLPTLALLAAASALAAAGAAQGPAPLLKQTFDEDAGGWTAQGGNARATITQQTTFNGKGALKFDYDVGPVGLTMLVLPVPDAKLTGAKSLRFWVRSDAGTSLAVVLHERDGGNYSVSFAAPKDRWQEVALADSDFALTQGANDPPDPDGKLDMDRVESVALVDIVQAYGVAGNPEISKALGVTPGARTLYLDDFTATAAALPPGVASAAGELRPDTFVRPQVAWTTLGGGVASNLPKTAAEPGMQVDYRQAPGRLMALMRQLPKGKLQGLDRLALKVSCTRATTLLVQLEEAGGGKFNAPVAVSEGGAAQAFTILFADMTPGDDSKVKDRKLKPELVTQLVLLDASAMTGAVTEERDNKLCVTGLRATAGK